MGVCVLGGKTEPTRAEPSRGTAGGDALRSETRARQERGEPLAQVGASRLSMQAAPCPEAVPGSSKAGPCGRGEPGWWTGAGGVRGEAEGRCRGRSPGRRARAKPFWGPSAP